MAGRPVLVLLCAVSLAAAAPAQRGPADGRAAVDWVRISSGTFLMGSEAAPNSSPRHQVLVRSFELARTPVTFRQYRACVAAQRCTPPHVADETCLGFTSSGWTKDPLPLEFQGDDQPVVCVDWEQAGAFSRWVGGRLPSEAEWEYAARSQGRDAAYPWGDEAPTCDRAVFDDGREGCGRSATWRVCSRPRGNTEQGLCDMAGNVMEWMQDAYHSSYLGAPGECDVWEDPEAAKRVVRGGSWYNGNSLLPATARGGVVPDLPSRLIGFRPMRLSPGEPMQPAK
ncbi:MAG: SUMF1/EgtB/PvdO family nonheme iron enzyme [Elusimicrobia bacterium]|nr:SUMF1/EgtB/PvdO family nonheme iron enzyme [Elusimicrobiota bacterium]